MRSLYLIRHGETDWNIAGRYQGQSDIPLNDQGRAQSAALRERLQKRPYLFDPVQTVVISSDLSRAKESADIAFLVPGRTIHVDPGLRELRYGIFEGLSREEIREMHGEAFSRFSRDQSFVIEGGEARATGRARAVAAVEQWLQKTTERHVVIVTHGGILRQLLLHTFQDGELPTHVGFSNMCVHTVHIDETGWTYAGTI